MFTYLALSKAGYGTLAELRELDTPDLFDIIEFEQISADIQHYERKR